MSHIFAGVMTGTSMDAIDVALIDVTPSVTLGNVRENVTLLNFLSRPLDVALADGMADLQEPGEEELHRAALLANALSDAISRTVLELLAISDMKPDDVRAIGVHGQTVRHRPELGYTLQLLNPSRIAEATSITVVSDFRNRDIAAGGQGAPLVPIFHQAIFRQNDSEVAAVVNIGGIANVSWLAKEVLGYDTGPGNTLMDLWCQKHLGKPFDENGKWAKTGTPSATLLADLLKEPFFARPLPRSTGKELFNLKWLQKKLSAYPNLAAQDVQATLALLTAKTIADEIGKLARNSRVPEKILICGGGALNQHLMELLASTVADALGRKIPVSRTDSEGFASQTIEASAFAWLAYRTMEGRTASLPSVTGALGPRILGSITPR